MYKLVWMALLKYFQLMSTHIQPLPDSNVELSPLSGISSANACVGKLLNYKLLGLVMLIVARGPYANL